MKQMSQTRYPMIQIIINHYVGGEVLLFHLRRVLVSGITPRAGLIIVITEDKRYGYFSKSISKL